MASKILLKKSTTASAVPTTSDVDVGEVAVNTEDKRLFTQDNGGSVVELGTTPSSVAVTGNATVGGTLGVTGTTTLGTANITTATVSSALSVPTPTLDAHAATKGYVDTEITSAVSTVIDSAPGALDTLNELAAALGDDANFSTTITTSIATKLPKDGSEAMTGNLDAGSNKVVNVTDPTSAQDAATKTYVDTADATKLNLSGGTMTGDIVMGANSVTSTATPATDDELTRKGYVDGILGSATAAATSATEAANSATAAASSATDAQTAQTAAETAQTGAEAALTDFDSVYQRGLATAPALDRNGNALTAGDIYFDTTLGAMYVYDGSAWDQVALTASDFLIVNNNLSDLNNPTTAISNLGLASTYNGELVAQNLTLTGYLRGPSTFTIDPATHGDDTGTLVVAGNLQVDGTTTTINSTTMTVDDKNIVLASGAADASAANGAGITIDGASATITYDSSTDSFDFNKDVTVNGAGFASTGKAIAMAIVFGG